MKHLIRVTAVLITFSVGLFFSFFFNALLIELPKVEIEESHIACSVVPLKVSLCELDSFPDKYDGKWIATEATVFSNGYGENVLFPVEGHESACVTMNDIHFTFLELKNFEKFQTDLKNNKPYHKEVDVRIRGMVKIIDEKHIGKSYLTIPNTIEIISPFKKFTPKGAA